MDCTWAKENNVPTDSLTSPLKVTAPEVGVGAGLSQRDDNKKTPPLCRLSHRLISTERNDM